MAGLTSGMDQSATVYHKMQQRLKKKAKLINKALLKGTRSSEHSLCCLYKGKINIDHLNSSNKPLRSFQREQLLSW